jgi:hypothetical protein
MSVAEAYSRLRKKHPSLPSYAEVDRHFRISLLESEEHLLEGIRQKMVEALDVFTTTLECMMNPDTASLRQMYEYRCFDDDDRNAMLEVYRKLMLFDRELLELDLVDDEKQAVEIVRRITESWPGVKKAMLPFVRTQKACWEGLRESKEIFKYMG